MLSVVNRAGRKSVELSDSGSRTAITASGAPRSATAYQRVPNRPLEQARPQLVKPRSTVEQDGQEESRRDRAGV
jgi:hypothetical protein